MKERLAGEEGLLTAEQRNLLRKQIDARVGARLAERGERRIASPGGYVPKAPKQAKS